jgi:hypothetical protein
MYKKSIPLGYKGTLRRLGQFINLRLNFTEQFKTVSLSIKVSEHETRICSLRLSPSPHNPDITTTKHGKGL